jgi:hypothetical protein
MVQRGELAAIRISGTIRISPQAIAQAEQGMLAVKPRRKRRERIDPELAKLLE